MRVLGRVFVALVVTLAAAPLRADDLTGATRFLCASVQANECLAGSDCEASEPWELKLPEFIEVDLDAKKLGTTAASGENRSTPISHLIREDGLIVLQGFEMGRSFSFVITESTGRITAAVAREDRAVVVFGSCTPQPATAARGRK